MKTTLIKTRLGMLMLSGLILATTTAQADWGRHDHRTERAYRQSQAYSQQINTRQARQMDRIKAGKQNGSLTHSEVRNLMREQREIQVMARHFRTDGFIDIREFRHLAHALDQADHNIRAKRNVRQARYGYNARPRFN